MSESDRPGGVTPDDLPELPQARWRSLIDDLASFPAHMRERGMAAAREGRVGPLVSSEHSLAAAVQGTRVYRTTWTWDDGDDLWHPRCTCKAASSSRSRVRPPTRPT
jgi:hypothetical protein